MEQKKLNIIVRKDLSQKSYRMAMAVHAAIVWTKYHGNLARLDWMAYPYHGPVILIYAIADERALRAMHEALVHKNVTTALYTEPDHNNEAMSLAFYGFMPEGHGLALL